jgi:NurA-like 5'-3' nuclease
VDFFYVRVGEEVARVEVPRWVSEDPELFLLLKSCVWDQVEKGGGYPVVLAEAHEQAVVRGSDRDLFFRMLEGSFVRKGIPAAMSAKGLRKRRMAV